MVQGEETRRLAIGPANSAGQAYCWANAVTQHLGIPAESFAYSRAFLPGQRERGFQFPVHHVLPNHRITRPWAKRLLVEHLLSGVTHVAVDGFLSLFDRLDASHVGNDVPRLRAMGLDVALIAHGSEVRDPDAHMARFPFSYYRDAPDEWVARLRLLSRRNRQTAGDSGCRVFVSTPDLLLDLPAATWLPVAVDVAAWRVAEATLSRDVPRVVHAPSRRVPPIKGTAHIDPVLRRLHDSGRIVYVSPGVLPRGKMQAVIKGADIVVDQVATGSYGVAAVEAMAAARLVVGYLGPEVKSLLSEPAPIIDAEPAQFEAVMEEVLADADGFAETAARGPTYVERWHDGSASAEALSAFLDQSTG